MHLEGSKTKVVFLDNIARKADVLYSGLSELARGALYLPILQLLAYHRSAAKGLDPDKPTHLEAVVKL